MKLNSSLSLGLFSLLALAGCGGKDGPPALEKKATVPVSGIVTYNSKPLANASVAFHAIDGKATATGKTDSAGTYTLTTYSPQDGAPVGLYKVTVAVSNVKEIEPGVLADEPPGGFKSIIPQKYANPSQTDITKEVKEGGGNVLIEIK